MKKAYLFITILFVSVTSYAQSIVSTRICPMEGDGPVYTVDGSATLTEYSDGSLTFTFGDDYSTQSGPDVKLYLTPEPGVVTGGVLIADLSSDGHFSGAKTYDVPSGVTINQFDHLTFRCVEFGQRWGKGTFEARVVTSIFDKKTSGLELFPNPANSNITVTIPESVSNATIEIYSAQGILVSSLEASNDQTILDVNTLKNGIYTVAIRTEETTFSEKLLIE